VANVTPDSIIGQYKDRVQQIRKRYPLLNSLTYGAEVSAVVDYINMVEQQHATRSN
jgi:hypothetical protein